MMTTLRASLAAGACLISAAASATELDAPNATLGIAEGSDIVVTATKANEIAPVTASLETTEPQAIVSRSFIEDSLPATADFNAIALISPSVSNFGNNNGVGLSESKGQIRGFQDGEYNITYDGVPFGDQNDPPHLRRRGSRHRQELQHLSSPRPDSERQGRQAGRGRVPPYRAAHLFERLSDLRTFPRRQHHLQGRHSARDLGQADAVQDVQREPL